MKNKGWVIFGIFLVAAIVAFAIYKASSTTNTVVQQGGGSTTKATNGIGNLVGSFFGTTSLGSLFSSFGGDDE